MIKKIVKGSQAAEPKFLHLVFEDATTGEVTWEALTMGNDVQPTPEQVKAEAERVFKLPRKYWKVNDCGVSAEI